MSLRSEELEDPHCSSVAWIVPPRALNALYFGIFMPYLCFVIQFFSFLFLTRTPQKVINYDLFYRALEVVSIMV